MPDDFDAILDHCIADIVAGRETVDSCLRRYSAHSARLRGPLGAAERMRAAPLPTPLATDKRRALESQLLRQAEQLRSKPMSRPAASRLPLWRRVGLVIASFLVVFLLWTSVASATAASVPGNVLYPIKRAAERVRLSLAAEDQRAELHLEFAQHRLQELRVLKDRGEVSESLLAEISGETARVLEEVPSLPHEKQQALLSSLAGFQDQQLQVLEVMASTVQGEAQGAVQAALADSLTQRQHALDLLAGAASNATSAPGSSPESKPSLGDETQPASGKPTLKPSATDKPVPQATARPTKEPPVTPQKPTPKVEHTPPGQVDQPSPPGQADQPTPHSPTQKPTKTPKK
jgi:hypothetical protein